MRRLKCSVFMYLLLIIDAGQAFNIIGINKQMLYEYVGNVLVGAKPQDEGHPSPPTTGWIVRGKLTLQRQSELIMAAALVIDDVTLNNSGEKFLQNKEMYPPYKPFKIVLSNNTGTISHIIFKEGDPIWSMNFKRAIASILQFQMKSSGAFVIDELGIHGKCQTEYFISNKTNYISIRKTPELKTCTPYSEAVHVTRSNVPPNTCEFDYQKSVIIGNEAIYGLLPHNETGYFLSMAHAKGTTLIHTFESTGEAQYINSELLLNFLKETSIDNPIDIETSMASELSNLELESPTNDPTGGRNFQQQETLIADAAGLLDNLAEALESTEFKFSEPYDSTLSDVIRILSQLDFDSLKKLYTEVDIGTSYRQETIRNIFHEIIPRIGTKASVFLTHHLVTTDGKVKPPIAVQLLIPMPFHIFELSAELVHVCQDFLKIGPDRPDVRQAAILSFATLVYNVYVAHGIDKDQFEEYVQKYFNLYLNDRDYEQKMLYLQGLSNLQLGNVASYLEPIVSDPNENEDLKFMAAWTTLALADTRAERIYEIYWPIFESRNASLELRVAAVTLLLISNPTAARLISIHRIIQSETDPHMINYYRTTVTSISETTYPCYQHLRRLLSYMHRHLPQKPEPRYWVTGNYIFDYRDSKFGIGAMLQAFLVGDPKSDMPVVAYFKFDTEALGKFTGQLALYIKARGLPDAILSTIKLKNNSEPFSFRSLKTLLSMLKAPIINPQNLHIEFILQMEGKTVLSYYLNQRMFRQLTYDNILDRLQQVIRTDSHINMQTVRWPFMNKYSVPTVLGTTADVLLQTTVLTSLRGNITEHRTPPASRHTLEIDARYSSYASVCSRSYNPFLNLDHEIIREQGFLIYVPFSIEWNRNENGANGCTRYSFIRPQNLTSGLSFKSRAVTKTRGLITKTAAGLFEEIMLPERNREVFQLFSYDVPDLGIKLTINTNLNELVKYRGMLLKSEFIENGFSRNMALSILMYIFGFTQLSSIHLGHDRNFTLLMFNENATRVDGNTCVEDVLNTADLKGKEITFTVHHTDLTHNVEALHKWNVSLDVQTSKKSSWFKIIGKIQRSSKDNEDWKACTKLTYEPLVFTKRPHTLIGYVVFGLASEVAECPESGSTMQFAARAGPSEHAHAFLRSDKISLTDTDFCPKEVLKFSPIPTSKYCKRSNFENFTSITQYDMDLKFNNMPAWFELWSTRLDHLVSAFSAHKVNSLHMSQEINITMHTPHDYFWINVEVNGVNWRIYHIPFLYKLDSKFDASHELTYDSGLKRSCSVINGMINTFDDYLINLREIITNPKCLTLLAADCSSQPKMAVFLIPTNSSNYGLRVHIGQNYFNFNSRPGNISQTSNDDPVVIYLNGNQPHNVRDQAYQWPETSDYDFRVELNEQNILIVECSQLSATIQFDLYNILNFEIFGVNKRQICGLCSKPLNRMQNYTLCEAAAIESYPLAATSELIQNKSESN
ncbi:vitellogenin-5 [Drosophila tropicalis]|uniref:vitellogenin-5 n=1 Tax=Drosophila tropicalis TaxID=46794 RepID=UPI0035AC1E6C